MKIKSAADIAGALLGLAFLIFGLNFFLHFLPEAPPPRGSAAEVFAAIMFSTGYLVFVKVLEILGGVLVAIPRTRNFGLLILGPIIVNILCFNLYLPGASGLFSPPVIGISLLALFLLWSERKAFATLLNREPAAAPKDQ
jgi:putative oxidoreductase